MSDIENGEVHIDETDASGGSKEGVVRYVLLISLLSAAIIMSIVWITGAVMQDDDDTYVSYTAEQAAADDGASTDGVLVDPADDTTAPATDAPVEGE